MHEGLALARKSLGSGAALDVFERLRVPSRLEIA
jgi:hypothetical protein